MAPLLVAAGMSASMAASVASVASVVATVASVGTAVAVPVIQGKQQQKMDEANAQRLRQEGRQRELEGSIAAERQRRQNRAMIARQAAGQAEAGALSGSSLDLLDANTVALEMDALTVAYQGELQGRSLNDRAGLLDFQGRQAGQAGLAAGAGGLLSSAGRGLANFDPLNTPAATPAGLRT